MNTNIKTVTFYLAALLIVFGLCVSNSFIATLCSVGFGVAAIYGLCHNASASEIREFTLVNWFQKKTGIDLFEE